MDTIIEEIEKTIVNLLTAAEGEAKTALSELGIPIALAAKIVLALPPIQELLNKIKTAVATAAGNELVKLEDELKKVVPDWLKGLWEKSKPVEYKFNLSVAAAEKLGALDLAAIDKLLGVA